MKRLHLFAFVIACMIHSMPSWANPTGAPLLYFPVEPCRFMDTRTSGTPLANNTALDGFVRGSNLLPATGAATSDCGVPPSAEAVNINVTLVGPTGNGYLKLNGTGFVTNPNSPYARIVYRLGENDSNEMTISLCNLNAFPASQEPCLYDSQGRYADLQVINFGSAVHVVGDVMGYYARAEESQ